MTVTKCTGTANMGRRTTAPQYIVIHYTAGTQTGPIPWTSGMTAHKGLYYTEDGKTYLCIREDAATGTELYYKISDLLGNYFEAVTA